MKRKTAIVLGYNTQFIKEPEGGYSVFVPDLPGCHSQGDTFQEAKTNIREAIRLCLNVAKDDNDYALKIATRKHQSS